jgi:hypothetical protein
VAVTKSFGVWEMMSVPSSSGPRYAQLEPHQSSQAVAPARSRSGTIEPAKGSLAYRGSVLPPQRLPPRCHPLRQPRRQLRLSHRSRCRHRLLVLCSPTSFLGGILNVEASHLAVSKAEDVSNRRLALKIVDGGFSLRGAATHLIPPPLRLQWRGRLGDIAASRASRLNKFTAPRYASRPATCRS